MTELDAVQQAERRAMAGDRQAVLLIVSELRRCREQAKADAHALADVRTLDAWAKAQGQRIIPHPLQAPNGTWGVMGILGGMGIEAPTPDAARAAAAAWVRDQALSAPTAETDRCSRCKCAYLAGSKCPASNYSLLCNRWS